MKPSVSATTHLSAKKRIKVIPSEAGRFRVLLTRQTYIHVGQGSQSALEIPPLTAFGRDDHILFASFLRKQESPFRPVIFM